MLLYENQTNIKKSLSMFSRQLQTSPAFALNDLNRTKALQYARLSGSLTVEAAFVTPFLLFFVLVFLYLFFMIGTQIQVTAALQQTARTMAASYIEAEEPNVAEGYLMARRLFWKYMDGHELLSEEIRNNRSAVSFLGSDFSGDFIKLYVSYDLKLPVFWEKWGKLPIQQQVVCKKWTGASGEDANGEDTGYVYITPYGNAYHTSTSCSALDLSVRGVSMEEIKKLRNRDGSIYYPCRCAKGHLTGVYITDYGTEYHGSVSCSKLKRTVYRVPKSEIGERHACKRCQP